MDGDGDLDLFVHLHGGAVLFEQDTPGQFVDVAVISGIDRSPSRGGYGTAWVDYDGDGDLDLFRSNISSSYGRNTLFRNNSTAINWLAAELLSVESATKPIAARVAAWVGGVPQYRNVNGESNLLPVHFGLGASTTVDSLIVEWPSGGVSSLINPTANTLVTVEEPSFDVALDTNGDPLLTPAPAFSGAPSAGPITATFSEALTAGSVDTTTFVVHSSQRGRLFDATDVVLSNGNLTATFQPDGTFFPGETVFATLTTSIEAASGATLDKGYVWQFTSEVSPTSPAVFAQMHDLETDAFATSSVHLGDVNGDGNLDLLTGNSTNVATTNRLYLGDGAGYFGAGAPIGSEQDATLDIAVGDVDGDGDLDLVSGNYGAANLLYLGDGAGGFSATGGQIDAVADTTRGVNLGDVDGDGYLDFVVGNDGASNQLYLWNSSTASFDAAVAITADAHSTWSVSLGDVDNDGDLDMIAGNLLNSGGTYVGESSRLYRWDAAANAFAVGEIVTASTDNTIRTSLGDLNGDGYLDLVAGNTGGTNLGQADKLYLWDPANDAFDAGAPIGSNVLSTYATALGDLDGDGDLDLIAGTQQWTVDYDYMYLWDETLNGGNGGFAAGVAVSQDLDNVQDAALGDIDNDGDLDLVFAVWTGSPNRIYLNSPPFNVPDGLFASGLDLDGVDDYVEVADAASLNTYATTNEITLEYWLYPRSLSVVQNQNVMVKRDGSNVGGFNHEILANASGITASVYFSNTSSWSSVVVPLTANQWVHVAMTYSDATGLRVYENGVPVDSLSATGTLNSATVPMRFGANSANGSNYTDAIIDEVRLWSVARTEAQIVDGMNRVLEGDELGLDGYWRMDEGFGTVAYDQTANANDGTLTNMDAATDWVLADHVPYEIVAYGTTPHVGVLPGADADGDPLTYSIVTDGTGGTAT
jgi:hypothetical protein